MRRTWGDGGRRPCGARQQPQLACKPLRLEERAQAQLVVVDGGDAAARALHSRHRAGRCLTHLQMQRLVECVRALRACNANSPEYV